MYAYFENIEALKISRQLAKKGNHTGDCYKDLKEISEIPGIKKQLEKINAESLKSELKEWGAWSREELSDHKENLLRILWLACGFINEEYK